MPMRRPILSASLSSRNGRPRVLLPNAFAFQASLAYILILICGVALSWSKLGGDWSGSSPGSSLSDAAPTPTHSRPTSPVVGELIEETGFYQSIRLTSDPPIYRKRSKYQLIEVHQSPYYGKVLVLDGVVQLTERDADSYNEMMAHIPMFGHKNPRRVLIVGGGDGYVLSEVLKHDSVEDVDHVDLDGEIVETCKKYFGWSQAWSDPRVKLHVEDGAAFVKNAPEASYDVVIQDSSDPWTWGEDGEKVVLPSSVLYSDEHFAQIHRVLKPNGILNLQAETLQIPSDLDGIRDWRRVAMAVGFAEARYGSLMISSYPTGQIGFLLCEKDSKDVSSAVDIEKRYTQMVTEGKGTSYYHPPQQTAAFVLPLWAERHLYEHGDIAPPSCPQNKE